ncbi:MAG: TolC family protein [Longimicrobiales bacterium]
MTWLPRLRRWMTRLRRVGLGLGLGLGLGSTSVAAQQPATIPQVLTLEEALGLAEEHSPPVRQARNAVEAAEAQERAAWGAFLPQASASFGLSGGVSQSFTGIDDFGRPIERDSALEFESSGTSQGIGLSVTLFDGGARFSQLDAAQAQRSAAVEAARSDLRRVRGEVARQYWAVLFADRLAELQAALLAAARERLEATERLLTVGARQPLDVAGAQVEVATREQAVAEARGRARKDRLELVRLMGIGGAADFRIAAERFPLLDPATLDVDALVGVALQQNPELLRLAATGVAAEEQLDVARAARWPIVRLSGGLNRSVFQERFGLMWEPNPLDRTFSFNLSATLPLFTGFDTSSRIAAARATLTNAREQHRTQQLQLESAVRGAVVDLENAYQAVVLGERSVELSRQNVEMAQQQYETGALSFLEYQQVIAQAAQTEQQLLQARLAYAQGLVRLQELVGEEAVPQPEPQP